MNHTGDSSTLVLLKGWQKSLGIMVWAIAVLMVMVMKLYALWAFHDYLNVCIVPVTGTWNAQYSGLHLLVLPGESAPNIQDGDLLVAINKMPLTAPITFVNQAVLPLYGACQTPVSASVRRVTEDETRVIELFHTVSANSSMRYAEATGQNRAALVLLWMFLEALWQIIPSVVAISVAWRRRDQGMALFLSVNVLALFMRSGVLEQLRFYPSYEHVMLIFISIQSTLLALMILTFPTGRFQPKIFSLVYLIVYGVFVLNRFVRAVPVSPFQDFIFDACLILGTLAVQAYRYNNYYSVPQRQQTKWVVALLGLGMIGYMMMFFSIYIFQFNDDIVLLLFNTVGRSMAVIGMIGLTISTINYRLYNADVVLNRNMVYGSLAGIFILISFIAFLLIQVVVPNQNVRIIAIIGGGLAFAAIFQSARKRVQRFVDTRFFRLRQDLETLKHARMSKAQPSLGQGAFTGKTLNQLKLFDVLGVGGMGEVYHGQLGVQKLAVKVVPPSIADNPQVVERFAQEMMILSRISHPNVVHLIDMGKANGSPYFAMEYVVGQPLNVYIKMQGALPLDQARLILKDIAAALDYVHSLGIVHRDIKPANIILQEMRAILIDFGLAFAPKESKQTNGEMIGTLEYASPEQITAAMEVGPRADIYALGVVAYEMLTGKTPFTGNVPQVLFAHLNQPPTNPCFVQDALPSFVGATVLRALSKKPEDRFDSAGAFVAALG
jgi:predicted Ser/Thr protein kinase